MNYQEMNREERYFCFLLGHALLTSSLFRDEFCKLIDLPSEGLEVYPEAAWLRDYWSSLGYETDEKKKRKKSADTERKKGRRQCLENLFCVFDLKKIFKEIWPDSPFCDLSCFQSFEEDFFWSKEVSGEGELVYPGRWPLALLDKYDDHREQLMRIKWAFNAKPDLMLVSRVQTEAKSVLLEVKVESNEGNYSYKGKNPVRSNQLKTQKLVGALIENLSELYPRPKHYFLSKIVSEKNQKDDVKSVLWKDVIKIAQKVAENARHDCDKLDDFTLRGFAESLIIRS